MVETGQFLQLVEVFRVAAVPTAAAFSMQHSMSVPAILSPVLRAVFDLVHAETFAYKASIRVAVAQKITRAMVT